NWSTFFNNYTNVNFNQSNFSSLYSNYSTYLYANASHLINGTTNQYNLTLNQENVQGNVNDTKNLTLFASANGTSYIQFQNRTASALVACSATTNATLAANNTGLWWCGGTGVWTRIGAL
ncbi:MAG: hypothetical protein WAU65_03265, partial [Candidatus Nanoarchaeia archaeon]